MLQENVCINLESFPRNKSAVKAWEGQSHGGTTFGSAKCQEFIKHCETISGWWLNHPSENISQMGNLPQIGIKLKKCKTTN